jgi:hypothetical protein
MRPSSLRDRIPTFALDGEDVAFRDGEQSFEALQGVMRRRLGVEDGAFLAVDLLAVWAVAPANPYAERARGARGLQFEAPVAIPNRFDQEHRTTLRTYYERSSRLAPFAHIVTAAA